MDGLDQRPDETVPGVHIPPVVLWTRIRNPDFPVVLDGDYENGRIF